MGPEKRGQRSGAGGRTERGQTGERWNGTELTGHEERGNPCRSLVYNRGISRSRNAECNPPPPLRIGPCSSAPHKIPDAFAHACNARCLTRCWLTFFNRHNAFRFVQSVMRVPHFSVSNYRNFTGAYFADFATDRTYESVFAIYFISHLVLIY